MPNVLQLATPADAEAVAAVRNAAAARLVIQYGPGHWGLATTARGVLSVMRLGKVYVYRRRKRVLATLCLTRRKPWAIDTSYFSAAERPLYLIDMAVMPDVQRRGIGRSSLEDAGRIARTLGADAIRLDAYDAAAGAGEFYVRCGYREVGRRTYRDVPLRYFERLLGERSMA